MGECGFCEQEMMTADSCTKNIIVYPTPESPPAFDEAGIYFYAVPYGEEEDWPTNERCHDCGVTPGGYHHPGCDVERDPIAGTQLLTRVIQSEPAEAPAHARMMTDPHADISMDDIITAQEERLRDDDEE